MLKIGYFAHGPWGHLALEKLIEDPQLEIDFIATRTCGDVVLEKMADDAGIPFIIPGKINTEETRAALLAYGSDIFVSMSYDQIFKKPLYSGPRLGTINCHAGALPFYRGRNILNWAILHGEKEFGITVHEIDDGIDTGRIYRQDFIEITEQDTYATVLEKAITQCPSSLYEALKSIAAGDAVPIEQDKIHRVGFYCGRRREGDEWLDWRWSSERIHNFVRGLTTPGPGAHVLLKGKKYAITKSGLIEDAPAYTSSFGEVVGRTEEGITVKTGDTTIKILGMYEISEDANNDVFTPTFPIGTRFDVYVDNRVYELENRIKELEKLLKG